MGLIMDEMRFYRQQEILSPVEMKDESVTVIGVGGIGSPTVKALAQMGIPEMLIYDDDIAQDHNRAYQSFRTQDVGRHKVTAIKEIVAELSDTKIETITERYTGQDRLSGIVIAAVDTMAARKTIFESVVYRPSVKLYVEARMGAEVLRLYTLRPQEPDKIDWYQTHMLYDDEEAEPLVCTAQAINYTGLTAAALIAAQVKKFLKGENFAKEIIFDLTTLTLLSSI